MAFTLTLLGTDTQYKPDGYIPNTPSGETLSFISSRIKSSEHHVPTFHYDSDEDINVVEGSDAAAATINPGHYRDQIYVINGPDTSGHNAYDKVAEGLRALLDPIARGENIINIIGHSRGAVESIIVAHEIQRIQDTLRKHPEFDSIDEIIDAIANSDNEKTKAVLTKLLLPLKQNKDVHKVQAIAAGFRNTTAAIELNIFSLDPVPGDFVLLLSLHKWTDNRYFSLPPIVRDYRQIILENERSRGFRAIIPRVEDPEHTQFSLLNMPGHHGTASGNPYSQQLFDLKKGNTSHVQLITICQLHDFLSQHGVSFDSAAEWHLDGFFASYNNATKNQRAQIRKTTYDQILENKSAYEAFDHTAYITTQDHGISRHIIGGYINDRIVYYHNAAETHMRSVLPFNTQGYINAEHACLALNLDTHFNGENAAEQLIGFTQCFLGGHPEEEQLVAMFDPTQQKPDFIKHIVYGLHALVENVVQTYLRNNLSDEHKNIIVQALAHIVEFSAHLCREDNGLILSPVKASLMDKLRSVLIEQVNSQFDDLSTLVHALNADDLDPTLILNAFEKYQQFKACKKHLDELLELNFQEDDRPVFEKQSLRLKFYAESVVFFCAQALVNQDLELPDELTTEPFGEKVQAVINGLLRGNHPQLLATQQQFAALQAALGDVEDDLDLDLDTAIMDGVSLQLLGAFSLALGAAAVALAFTTLAAMHLGLLVIVPVAAVGVGLAAFGLFCYGKGVEMRVKQSLRDDLDELNDGLMI